MLRQSAWALRNAGNERLGQQGHHSLRACDSGIRDLFPCVAEGGGGQGVSGADSGTKGTIPSNVNASLWKSVPPTPTVFAALSCQSLLHSLPLPFLPGCHTHSAPEDEPPARPGFSPSKFIRVISHFLTSLCDSVNNGSTHEMPQR